jgi:hypothetical protein
MVAGSGTLTLGLADLHQPAWGGCKPLVDVVFVGRLRDHLTMATHEGEYLDSLFHR